MSCQAIQQNGNKCGNTAKKEYDHKYCGKHIRVWIALQEQNRQDKISKDLQDIKQQLNQGLNIIKQENNETRRIINDVIMKEADEIHDTIIGETRNNRIMINDNIAFQIMAFYHNLYASNNNALSTFESVNDKIIDIIYDQNSLVLTDLRSSKNNHQHFINLVQDFVRYLPQQHKYDMMEQIHFQLSNGLKIF